MKVVITWSLGFSSELRMDTVEGSVKTESHALV
jgi:hypothetical protein